MPSGSRQFTSLPGTVLWPVRLRAVIGALGLYALLGGLISFLGWALGIRRLTDWDNNQISIQPNAALCVILAGLALLMLICRRRRIAAVLGLIVALIGGATLFGIITGARLGFHSLLMFGREWGRGGTLEPGRMGPPGATSWTLIGTALLMSGAGSPRVRRIVPLLGLITLAISLTSITSYLYGASALYTMPRLTVIALQTATFIFAVSLGVIACVPERQPMLTMLDRGAAGIMARRALPVIVIVSLGLGGLRLAAQNAGLFDTAFGTTLRSVVEILLLSALLWWALMAVRDHESASTVTRNRLSGVLGSISDALVTVDQDWRFTFLNDDAVKRIGLARDEVLGRSVWDVFPDAVGREVHGHLQRAMDERVSVDYEYFNEKWHGWFRDKAYPNDDGGLTIYSLNVSEQKRAGHANARLAAIVESSDDAIISKTLQGAITSWNRGAERLFGYTADEAIGQPITMLIPKDRLDEERQILDHIRRGEPVDHYETLRRRKDGTLVDVSLTVSPIINAESEIVGASKIARDITERRRVDEALRESRTQLKADLADARLLQQVSTEWIREGDAQALYEQMLDTAVGIMRSQYASVQMVENGANGNGHGEEPHLRLLGHRGFSSAAASFWQKVQLDSRTTCGASLRTSKRMIVSDVAECEFMAGSEDLSMFQQAGIRSMQSTPLVARDGRLVGIISTHWDHPHQPPEKQLRLLDVLARQAADLIERTQAQRVLQAALTQRTAQVTQAGRAMAVSQRMAAVGTLASGLAHDINNVTLPLGMRLDALLGNAGLDSKIRGELAVITALLDHLRQMSRNLSLFSHDPAQEGLVGATELASWWVNVQGLMDASLTAEGGAFNRYVRLKCEIPTGLPAVKVAPHRLTQAVLNLVQNARDAIVMARSQPNAAARDDSACITIAARACNDGAAVLLKVSDTGCGMDEETTRRSIEPFFTTKDRPTAAGATGSGMGLSLVHAIMEGVGGSMEIDSTPGAGTTVTLALPMAEHSPEIVMIAAKEKTARLRER